MEDEEGVRGMVEEKEDQRKEEVGRSGGWLIYLAAPV